MDRLRIGILSPSEIAFRRFLSAREKTDMFVFGGVAVADASEWFGGVATADIMTEEKRKAEKFSGKVYESYTAMLSSPEIDCVYIPLPPALHYDWVKKALKATKHVLVEKPCADSLEKTEELIELATKNNLTLHENYAFIFHNQITYIQKIIKEKTAGDVRLIRTDFAFPFRSAEDFRYNKALGGGALLDCGGYPIKLASLLLGDSARIAYSRLNYATGYSVDMYGSATMVNDEGTVAQLSFGMDNYYKCSLEVLGSKGSFFTNRVFSAPEALSPKVTVNDEDIVLDPDDAFMKSLAYFSRCITSTNTRKEAADAILKQARLVEKVKRFL